MKIRPLGDRVLVKRVKAEERSKGGIILPDTAKEKPKEGEVISVGAGKTSTEGEKASLSVKIGNKILFSSYAGTDVKIDGEEYLILKEEDILGIIEE